ncbi:T9SS type A sorting domain-containing protein [Luteibaculum oceani]|uniref:T9SS type A sorting domain-containing protein n=1 Tax=Luteibaculum oceani TaxID=1294296 RepID=A0A5C6UYC3_9FLAO|nr:T9SS type A sorting domain-containing protein [Luteibaculum oceani]TXC75635.1 T9SS type A sorting domain-containing protein [Luteibaculum oceani]
MTFNFSAISRALLPAIFVFFAVVTRAQTIDLKSFVPFDGIKKSGYHSSSILTSDNYGNTFILGEFDGFFDADPDSSAYELYSPTISSSGESMFISKFHENGDLDWAIVVNSESGVGPPTAAFTDSLGALYFVLKRLNKIKDGFSQIGSDTILLTEDFHLVKIDSTGKYLWDLPFKPDYPSKEYYPVYGLYEDSTFVMAYKTRKHSVFLALYDQNGDSILTKQIVSENISSNTLNVLNVESDSQGNLYVLGSFQGTCRPDITSEFYGVQSKGSNDVFVGKYDKNLNHIWSFGLGSAYPEIDQELVIDSKDSIYVKGIYRGATDFDPGVGDSTLTAPTSGRLFLAKYGPDKGFAWASSFKDVSEVSLHIDRERNRPILRGELAEEDTDLDPSPNISLIEGPAERWDAFIAQYTSNGHFISAYSWSFDPLVHIDGKGNLALTANISNDVLVDKQETVLVEVDPDSLGLSSEVLLARFNGFDTFNYAKVFGGYGWHSINSEVLGLKVHNQKAYVLMDWEGGEVDLDPSSDTVLIDSIPLNIAVYNADGSFDKAFGVANTFWNIRMGLVNENGIFLYGFGGYDTPLILGAGSDTVHIHQSWFVANLSLDGKIKWVVKEKIPGSGTIRFQLLDQNEDGIHQIAGYYATYGSPIDIDPTEGAKYVPDRGEGIFTMYIDADGNFINSHFHEGPVWPENFAFDREGNLLLAAKQLIKNFDLDPSANTVTVNPNQFYFAKFSPQLDIQWGFAYGGGSDEQLYDITVGSNNELYVLLDVRYGEGSLNPDPTGKATPLTEVENNVLIRYNSDGSYAWAREFEDYDFYADHKATGVCQDANGNIVVLGEFYKSLYLDKEGDGFELKAEGESPSLFLASYDTLGLFLGAKSIGGWGYQTTTSTNEGLIEVNTSGGFWIAGDFYDFINPDPEKLTTPFVLNTHSYADFIANYNFIPCSISEQELTDTLFISCQTTDSAQVKMEGSELGVNYFLRGATGEILSGPIKGTGSPIDFNLFGLEDEGRILYVSAKSETCVKVFSDKIILKKDVIPVQVDSIVSCFSYVWPVNGETYDSTGIYTLEYTNRWGCDSIHVLNLEVRFPEFDVEIVEKGFEISPQNAAFQWLDCNDNYSEIPGENSEFFYPTKSGDYAVRIVKNSCADTLGCYRFVYTDLFENQREFSDLKVIPNPSDGEFQISYAGTEAAQFVVLDGAGKKIEIANLKRSKGTIAFSMRSAKPGIYFGHLITETGSGIVKLIKK